jgi:hypothetical protein
MLMAAARRSTVRALDAQGRSRVGALFSWPIPGLSRVGQRARVWTGTAMISVDPAGVELYEAGEETISVNPGLL